MPWSIILRSNNLKASFLFLIISLICALILGFLTVNIVKATTKTIQSSTSDGFAERHTPPIHNGTTANLVETGEPYLRCGQRLAGGVEPRVMRTHLYFDSSVIPDDATISLANIRLYGLEDLSYVDFNITIQNGQPTYPHDPLKKSDYDESLYSGDGGQFNTSSFLVGGWNEISLNASWINQTSTTKLVLRSSRDINGIIPSDQEYVSVGSCESTTEPELYVEYTTPSSQATVEAPLFDFFINNTDGNDVTSASWDDGNRILTFTTTGNCYVDVGDYGNTMDVFVSDIPYTDWTYDETLKRVTINNIESVVKLDFPDPEPIPTGSTPSGVPLEPEMIEITTPTTPIKIPIIGLWVIIGGVGIFAVSAFYTKVSRPKRRKPRGVRPSPRRRRVPRKPKRSKRSGRFT